MSVTLTVLHPYSPGNVFNLEYYAKEHMDIVVKYWSPYGLKAWNVIKYAPNAEGSSPPYVAAAVFTWETLEGAQKALVAPEAKPVHDDVAEFSTVKPVLLIGTSVGTWGV